MKTTSVYRIEHTDRSAINIGTDRKIKGVNAGPYVSRGRGKSTLLSEMSNAHNNDYTHPSVRDDIYEWWSEDFNPYKHVCCFKTKKQVKTWFKGWFEVLHSEGYVLVKYTIKEDGLIMGRSKKQGIFNPKKIIERKVVGNLDIIK